MLKTTKRYVITTNAVNAYGFRVLTKGIDWSLYDGNPIMLYMHFRATGQNENEVKALGNVREIETDENGVVTGRLYFNDKYPFAVQMYDGYENGTYNMLSIGVHPVELSDAPELLLPGQTYPTVSKSIAKEISCVDIGANPEALGVALYDASGKIITLSDQGEKDHFFHNQISQMKILTLSAPAILTLLKLSDTTPEAEVFEKIKTLVTLADDQAAKIVTLSADKATAEGKVLELTKKLDDQVALVLSDKIDSLLNQAVADRKITADELPSWKELATVNLAHVEKVIGLKAGAVTVSQHLNTPSSNDKLIKLCEKTYDQLFAAGELEYVKLNDVEAYKTIYKNKFGSEPKNV